MTLTSEQSENLYLPASPGKRSLGNGVGREGGAGRRPEPPPQLSWSVKMPCPWGWSLLPHPPVRSAGRRLESARYRGEGGAGQGWQVVTGPRRIKGKDCGWNESLAVLSGSRKSLGAIWEGQPRSPRTSCRCWSPPRPLARPAEGCQLRPWCSGLQTPRGSGSRGPG